MIIIVMTVYITLAILCSALIYMLYMFLVGDLLLRKIEIMKKRRIK